MARNSAGSSSETPKVFESRSDHKMIAPMNQIKKRGGFHCKLVTSGGKIGILKRQLTSHILNTKLTSKVLGRAAFQ